MKALNLSTFLALVVGLQGCAYTVFAPPAVLYSTESTIGIKYRSAGVQSFDEVGKAMALISEHCNSNYEISERTVDNGWTTVDARCE